MYNAEEFLEYTLESLMNQTMFRNIEILLIDDCSTDKTYTIAESYEQQYPQFTLVRQEYNRGVSAARNLGLEQSKGQYIFFLDSDDTISNNTLEIMYQAAQEKKVDIITGIYKRFDSKSESVSNIFNQFPDLLEEGYKSIYDQPQLLCSVYSCGKLYKREILEQIRYGEDLNYCEDHVFTLSALLSADRIYNLPGAVYNYRIRDLETESLSQSVYKDPVKNMKYLIEVLERLKFVFSTKIQNYEKRNELFSVYLTRVIHWNIWTVISHGLLSTKLAIRHNTIELYLQWFNSIEHYWKKSNASDFDVLKYKILQISTVLDEKSVKLCHQLIK